MALRIFIGVVCSGVMYVLIQTLFKEPIETFENNAYRRVLKGLGNPRRVRDALLRISFLLMSVSRSCYSVLLVYVDVHAQVPLLTYSLVVLTTAVLYLLAWPDQTVSLRDFRGRPVILAFYPADWSPVCGDQMALYNELCSEFRTVQRRAARHLGRRRLVPPGVREGPHLHFPLLADFEPKGEVARQYGVYREQRGHQRAGAVRDRRRRRHPMELRLAGRRQSRGRRHSAGARGASASRNGGRHWRRGEQYRPLATIKKLTI